MTLQLWGDLGIRPTVQPCSISLPQNSSETETVRGSVSAGMPRASETQSVHHKRLRASYPPAAVGSLQAPV